MFVFNGEALIISSHSLSDSYVLKVNTENYDLSLGAELGIIFEFWNSLGNNGDILHFFLELKVYYWLVGEL